MLTTERKEQIVSIINDLKDRSSDLRSSARKHDEIKFSYANR